MKLKKNKIIEDDQSFVSPFAGMSRREAIRKVGLASMIALPVISSLVASTAAMAQSSSCVATGAPAPGRYVSCRAGDAVYATQIVIKVIERNAVAARLAPVIRRTARQRYAPAFVGNIIDIKTHLCTLIII